MSNPENSPVSPNIDVRTSTAAPFDRWRWLLAGAIGILGGYLTISAVISPGILNALVRPDALEPELMLPWVLQSVFALSVSSFAFFVAPGPLGRRVLAVVLFVVLVVVLFALIAGRYSGAIRIPGLVLQVVTNPYSAVLFVGGLSWLIASAARPIAYLTLLLSLIVMPLQVVFTLNNIASGLTILVQLVLSLAVAVVILVVSRPAGVTTMPAGSDRWRWALAGVIGILGGYLTLSLLNGGIIQGLSRMGSYDPEIIALWVAQGLFALAVTALAYFVASGPLGRRVLAAALFIVITIVLVAVLVARISGALQIPGPGLLVVTNPYWVVLFAGGLGWLIAASARPLAYLSLLLTFMVMPLGAIFVLNNIGFGISTVIQLVLSLAIALVILLVSRPAAPYAVPPVVAAADASPTAAELAPTAFVAMEEGAEADAAPRTPAP